MDRRLFIMAAGSTFVADQAVAQSSRTLTISEISVSGPLNTTTQREGQSRGVMSFRVRSPSTSSRGRVTSVEAFWNPNLASGPHQCPILIGRYALELGFADGQGRRWTYPTGAGTAALFASRSNGLFTPVKTQSTFLPKAGSVMSVAGYGTLTAGHVGILSASIANPTSDRVELPLFDQNWPSTSWKKVIFERPAVNRRQPNAARNWTARLEVTPAGSRTTYKPVVSWTEPTG